jgi:hypothetical protein
MKQFLLIAAAGVLALTLNGTNAFAGKHGPSHVGHGYHHENGRFHGMPRHLYGRHLPGDYARFSRFRYDARYRSRFYLAGNAWYYYYTPFRCYLPVEVIATYPPVIVTTPLVVTTTTTAVATTPAVVTAPAVAPPVATVPGMPPVDTPE